jgi:hypothetical protein
MGSDIEMLCVFLRIIWNPKRISLLNNSNTQPYRMMERLGKPNPKKSMSTLIRKIYGDESREMAYQLQNDISGERDLMNCKLHENKKLLCIDKWIHWQEVY